MVRIPFWIGCESLFCEGKGDMRLRVNFLGYFYDRYCYFRNYALDLFVTPWIPNLVTYPIFTLGSLDWENLDMILDDIWNFSWLGSEFPDWRFSWILIFHNILDGVGNICYISTWRLNWIGVGRNCPVTTWNLNYNMVWISGCSFTWQNVWLNSWYLWRIFSWVITGT